MRLVVITTILSTSSPSNVLSCGFCFRHVLILTVNLGYRQIKGSDLITCLVQDQIHLFVLGNIYFLVRSTQLLGTTLFLVFGLDNNKKRSACSNTVELKIKTREWNKTKIKKIKLDFISNLTYIWFYKGSFTDVFW